VNSDQSISTLSIESLNEEIQKLISQRRWIMERFTRDAAELVAAKDFQMSENLQLLRRLSVPEREIPFLESTDRGRRYKKLSNDEIKGELKTFLREGRAPTRVIIEQLGISFAAFKVFVAQNPTFLEKEGQNKGRLWRIR
jgi:hypothetical protein